MIALPTRPFLLTAALLLAACSSDDQNAQSGDVMIATSAGRLISVSRDNPANVGVNVGLGLNAGESVVAMDIRPADGLLYVLGNAGNLYAINRATGLRVSPAASVGVVSGSGFDMDFNPLLDRLRVVSEGGNGPEDDRNLEIELVPVSTGSGFSTVTRVQGAITPQPKQVTAAAYTNSFGNACETRLYTIDARLGELFVQDPENTGELTLVGSLGVSNIQSVAGFDISGAGNDAHAVFRFPSGEQALYRVNLSTGTATRLGALPLAVGERAVSLAVVPPVEAPVPEMGDLVALTRTPAGEYRLLSFNVQAPPINTLRGCTFTTLTGVRAGDVLRDLDVRPSDGKHYALATAATGGTGVLYEIDLLASRATPIRNMRRDDRDNDNVYQSLDAVEMGMHFAADANTDGDRGNFDYDDIPCGDRLPLIGRDADCLRVLTRTGQNFFVNVENGDVEAGPPATANVLALAAQNRFFAADPRAVTVFALDDANRLGRVAADGTFTAIGTGLGIGPMDNGPVAMDISAIHGRAFAAFDRGVNGQGTPSTADDVAVGAKICELNLQSGQALEIGSGVTQCQIGLNGNFIGGFVRDVQIGQVLALTASRAPQLIVHAATEDNRLVSFSPLNPNSFSGDRPIIGLVNSGEKIVGMDVRPATGLLYALGSSGQLYILNPLTGFAVQTPTLIPSASDDSSPYGALNGVAFGFDFNPTVDRLRVISDSEQNLRIRTANGETFTDGLLNPAGSVVAAAYTNNFSGATTNRLLVLDNSGADSLLTLVPSTGALSGALELKDADRNRVDARGEMAFDIAGANNGLALAALQTDNNQPSFLYRVDIDALSDDCEVRPVPSPRTCVVTKPVMRDTALGARIGGANASPIRAMAIELK